MIDLPVPVPEARTETETMCSVQPQPGKTDHIKLRLPYHRSVYVARICGRSRRYRLERDFYCLRRRREIADFNGGWIKWRVVYYLPLIPAVYEVRDDQSKRYYVGTRFGDPALYQVSLERLEALIDNDPDIDEVIGSKVENFEHPTMHNHEYDLRANGTNGRLQ